MKTVFTKQFSAERGSTVTTFSVLVKEIAVIGVQTHEPRLDCYWVLGVPALSVAQMMKQPGVSSGNTFSGSMLVQQVLPLATLSVG